jgi:cellulose synthase/poly-beta-1,6-N-acetylglucosamine synthase-like glycosyltransferase
VDQDCIVPPDWIFRLLAILSQEGVGGVGGSISVANPKNLSGWCVYFLEFLNHFPSYSKQATSARHLGKGFLLGANSAWRSEVFRSLSFPDQTLGEDLLLSQAVRKTNFSIIYDPTISVCHYNRSGWREFQRYCQDMGKSAAQDQRKIADWRFWLLEHFPLLSFGIPLIILPLVGWRLLRTSPGYMGRFLLLLPCCLWGQLIWAASFRQSLINSRAAEIHHH